jgi:hypothetical protein
MGVAMAVGGLSADRMLADKTRHDEARRGEARRGVTGLSTAKRSGTKQSQGEGEGEGEGSIEYVCTGRDLERRTTTDAGTGR